MSALESVQSFFVAWLAGLAFYLCGPSPSFAAPSSGSLSSLALQAQAPKAAKEASKSQILQITPYKNPFSGHHDFVEFMKTSPSAKPPWTDASLHAAFPPKLYARCFDPRRTLFAEVIYESPNGVTRGWMIRPLAARGKLPVVVYSRGGYASWGRVKHFALATLCRIAQRGYMVLASDFRGVAGVAGKQDSDDLGQGDVHDNFYFIDALKEHYPEMDTTKIAAWGFSRGTTISVMMATQSEDVKVVILQGTVANAVNNSRRQEFDKKVYPRVMKNWAELSREQQDKLLSEISPMHLIEQVQHRPSFAFFHGGLDWRTSPQDALRLAADLIERKFPVEFHLYPNTGHLITGRYADLIKEVMRVLDEGLKKQ